MTEILLIIPPFCYGDLSEAGPVYPSMGIVCVAATLEHAGYKVKIIDMFAEGYEESKLKSCLEDPELKIVGVSSVSATFKISLNILKYAKEKRPDTTTIIGGPHITILPDETMKETYIDYGVLGEGDNTAVELADLIIKNKGSPENIKGLCFRKDRTLIKTEKRQFIENLDELPFPAYHLLPMDKYRSYGVYDSGRKTTSMITSRGCPFKCIYCCSSELFGGRWRPMSAEKTIEFIKKLYDEYGIRHIYFQDDEFTVSHERAMKICDWIIDKKIGLTWECLTRVSHVDNELLSKMAKAGCKSILYGIETGYEEGLKQIKKGITLEQAKNAVRLTKKNGMIAKVSFILGFPWESKEEINKTIDFAIKLDADYSFFTILCPFPTTEVYEQIAKEGLFVPEFNMEMYSAMPAADSLIRTKYLTSEEIVQMMGHAYKRLYFRPKYLLKRMLSLRHFSELKRNFKAGLSVLRFTVKSMGKKAKLAKTT
ncbi:MAG TPA: radical SAM protein [Nanoarchaeota archaeon]|nr:radical SAM protein [Nanoarchaeota archaeon]